MNPTSDILQSLPFELKNGGFWRCGGFWLCIGSISVPGISRLAMLSSMPKSSHLNKIHNMNILIARFWTLSSFFHGGLAFKDASVNFTRKNTPFRPELLRREHRFCQTFKHLGTGGCCYSPFWESLWLWFGTAEKKNCPKLPNIMIEVWRT